MPDVVQSLRRWPVLFDHLSRLARIMGRRTALYNELTATGLLCGPFTFLQIGANDGISHDPFREFMVRRNARGIAVEPVPEYYQKLTRSYRFYSQVLTENCAVGYPSGTLPFFAFSDAYLKSLGKAAEIAGLAGYAGFDRGKLAGILRPNDKPSDCIRELSIPVRTVEQILDRHNLSSVDCLFMDCEGHEENILTHLDFERVSPRLIVFEHTHFGSHAGVIEAALAAQGFQFTRLQFDTIATR